MKVVSLDKYWQHQQFFSQNCQLYLKSWWISSKFQTTKLFSFSRSNLVLSAHLEEPEERMLSDLRREHLVSHDRLVPLSLTTPCQMSTLESLTVTVPWLTSSLWPAFSGMSTVLCSAVVAGSNSVVEGTGDSFSSLILDTGWHYEVEKNIRPWQGRLFVDFPEDEIQELLRLFGYVFTKSMLSWYHVSR